MSWTVKVPGWRTMGSKVGKASLGGRVGWLGSVTGSKGVNLALLSDVVSTILSKDHDAFAGFGAGSGSGLESRSTTCRFAAFGRSFVGLYVPNLSTGASPRRCPASPVPVDELGRGTSWNVDRFCFGAGTSSRSSESSSRSRYSTTGSGFEDFDFEAAGFALGGGFSFLLPVSLAATRPIVVSTFRILLATSHPSSVNWYFLSGRPFEYTRSFSSSVFIECHAV